ncbi:hypothetical protein AB5N19_11932 [Seiridium cardinale]|uniref:Uncharacterized protein n=1 Tax=Seiridium cardinale TaxID=138064 RepID=A0ABR2XD40_9PEZI
MKYTAVLGLFFAAIAVADLPYGMPGDKRENEHTLPAPPPWTAPGTGKPTGTGHHRPPPTGGAYPTGGPHHPGGPHPTGTGGGKPMHTVVKEANPKHTTLKTVTGTGGPKGTGHGGHGHHTGTGSGPKPTGDHTWTKPEKPTAPAA